MSPIELAAVLGAVVLVASIVSVEFGITVALVELNMLLLVRRPSDRGFVRPARSLLTIGAVLAVTVGLSGSATAGPSSLGPLAMVSANASRTDSAPTPGGTFGSEQAAVGKDGKVIAFVSKSPAQLLVNDPAQVGSVTDTNGVEDVFVWDARVPPPTGPVTTLVSWNMSHTGAGGGNMAHDPASDHPIIASDGIGIVFESYARDLTAEALSNFNARNLFAWVPGVNGGSLVLVNKNIAGDGSFNGASFDASIAVHASPLLAKVAFTSDADDLVTQPTPGGTEVFVRDLVSQSTLLVSMNAAGTQGTINAAQEPMISADGSRVAFASGGGDLVPGISGGSGNIWVRNLGAATTALVSSNAAGTNGTSGNNSPVISEGGTAVAWLGNDSNLSTTPHNFNQHVWYRSGAGPVQMVDTDSTGTAGCNVASDKPALSLDGNAVAFESACTDIQPPSLTDFNGGGSDVFVRRFPTDLAPRLVSVNDAGTGTGNGSSNLCPTGALPAYCGASTNPGVTLDADGTAVAFFSNASDIAATADPVPVGTTGVFVRFPASEQTVRLTLNAFGHKANGDSRDPVISADGSTVAFTSLAEDLVTPDTNQATDVFASFHTPTAVTLMAFRVRGRTVTWRTASEADIVGFELWREGRRLNRVLIAARGGPGGASYRYLDRSFTRARRSNYRLKVVHRDGTRTWVGAARA